MQKRSRLRPLMITEEELQQLHAWVRGRRAAPALALRARLVIACSKGLSNKRIAHQLRLSPQTVGKWRARFTARRLAGLTDAPRSGAPRSISDALVEAVLAKTLHESPPGAVRWSSRQLANALGISQRAVLRIWHTFDL
jgi:transposase